MDSIVWAASAGTPNDPDFQYQWGLPRVGAPTAWDTISTVPNISNVTVCVADSGVDVTQPDLTANLVLPGRNVLANDSDLEDGLKHGTHVAGIVAAVVNNGLEIAGVGFDHVS